MLATQDLPASSTGAELGQELKRVVHQRDLLDLQAAALAAQFAGTNEYDVQGYATAIDWMRFNCHLTSTAAADLIAAGKNLHRLPESVQAVCKGEIGYAHVKAMARTANAVGPKFDESSLLEKARDNSAGKFMRLDPAGDFDHPRLPLGHHLRLHFLYRLRRADYR